MDIDDIIYQLIDLRQNAEYQAQHDNDQLWQDDIKALDAAIEILRKYQQAGGFPDKLEGDKKAMKGFIECIATSSPDESYDEVKRMIEEAVE